MTISLIPFLLIHSEYPHLNIVQEFVYPDPSADGSQLIVPASANWRIGVNRDNQFAKQEQIVISNLISLLSKINL